MDSAQAESIVLEAISDGSSIEVTSELVSKKAFFGESIRIILFLDTGLPGDYLPVLKAISEYMELSYEVLPVGLSHLRNFPDTAISRWRAEIERNRINDQQSESLKKSADYFFIFIQLQKLVDYTDEPLNVKEVFALNRSISTATKYIKSLILN